MKKLSFWDKFKLRRKLAKKYPYIHFHTFTEDGRALGIDRIGTHVTRIYDYELYQKKFEEEVKKFEEIINGAKHVG